jgi:hypothetical protein
VKKLDRVYELWIGAQKSGKTTALRARVRWLAHMRSVTSVWVFDRLNEWQPGQLGLKSCSVYKHTSDFLRNDEIPRVVIWKLGTEIAPYESVLAEAVRLGDVAIVLDEAYEWAPAGAVWTGSHVLREIVLAGRHLEAVDGELHATHLIVAAQYPKSMHLLLWSQAYTVLVGKFSGEATAEWIRGNFGKTALSECEALGQFRWTAVRGERPDLPGYGPNG